MYICKNYKFKKELEEQFNEEDLKGKMAEELFEKEQAMFPDRFPYINGKKYFDVSSIPEFQQVDIDGLYCPPGTPKKSIIEILKKSHWFEKLEKGENTYTFYEIKADGRIADTRNLLYEVIKKDKPGRLAKSLADILIYIPVCRYYPYKFHGYYWVINMFKLREYIRKTLTSEYQEYLNITRRLAYKVKEGNVSDLKYLQKLANDVLEFKFTVIPYNFEKREIKPEEYEKISEEKKEALEIDGKILNLWVNIDKLVELGIAEKYEILTPIKEKEEIEKKWNEEITKLKNGTL